MERFDEELREMAEREAISTPEGFDGRLREALDGLPPRKTRRGLGAMKTALIAAAACALLAGTAFAASPGLREMLAEALGGFAPYAQELDSQVYTWNGFEIKALSAMADENMVRVFVQVRDMEKRELLDIDGAWGEDSPWLWISEAESGEAFRASSQGHNYRHYDGETQTAVSVVTAWGEITEDLTGAVLKADTPLNMMDNPQNAAVQIPFEVEVRTSQTVLRDVETGGFRLEEIRLSPLSVTVELSKDDAGRFSREFVDGETHAIRVKLRDGTVIDTEETYHSGHKPSGGPGTDGARSVLIWNLADPAEPDQVAGIYVGEDYFPIQ